MAIKTLNYTVFIDGVTPNYERRAGMQYDHNKTELQFTLDSTLYNSLLERVAEGSLNYRIDIVDGEGKLHLGEVKQLDGIILEPYALNYWVTKFGGKIKACLVITLTNNNTTTTEFSCEVVLSLEDLSETEVKDDSYKSLTTLNEQTAGYAQTVKSLKNEVAVMHGDLGEIKSMLDCGEWVFDGNTKIDINFVVDDTLNAESKNAIANNAVAEKFSIVENEIKNKFDNIVSNTYNSVLAEMRNELLLLAHPIGSYYWSSESTNPQNLFGGVWEQVKDIFVLAAGDNYSVGDIGGEATHKLVLNEMPKHGHRFRSDYASDGIEFVVPTKTTGSGTSCITREGTQSRPGHWANQTWGTNTAGGNLAHNNMPPYVVAYCFKRIG